LLRANITNINKTLIRINRGVLGGRQSPSGVRLAELQQPCFLQHATITHTHTHANTSIASKLILRYLFPQIRNGVQFVNRRSFGEPAHINIHVK